MRDKSGGEMFATVGDGASIQGNTIIGLKYGPECREARIGNNAVIRAYTVIYADTEIGDNFKTGHSVLIREHTKIGDHITIGTGTVIEGHVTIGNFVKIESNVYIPTHVTIGDRVFIGPSAVLTNDLYPLRIRESYNPRGPILEDDVSIGANATLLPGIRIGQGAMVAAGSVVTKDVTPWHLAVGVPVRTQPLPEHLKEPNRARSW